jgi:hypothetical protein
MKLKEMNYSLKQIAEFLGVSRTTLYRRLRDHGISKYTSMTNEELDENVRVIKQSHPNDGEVLVQGHLRRLNVHVPRQSLRDSIHRVDAWGVASRRRRAVRRRIYSVPYPNYIWHMDGHHKLIKWRFVIHGAIDGFSRLITFLSCSDNNCAKTVLNNFLVAVDQFGLPEHVRTDHGGENVDVWKYMITSHNFDYSTVMAGSSVHNERVERLWRDVNRCICQQFSAIFIELEDNHRFDPLNEVDIYCLHHVFLPKINKALQEFKESWNHHNISTEGNKTPYQLYFEGLSHMSSNHHFTPGLTITADSLVNIPVMQIEDDRLNIPRISFQPCMLLYQHISVVSAIFQNSNTTDQATYNNIIEIVGHHLINECFDCQ